VVFVVVRASVRAVKRIKHDGIMALFGNTGGGGGF